MLVGVTDCYTSDYNASGEKMQQKKMFLLLRRSFIGRLEGIQVSVGFVGKGAAEGEGLS